MKKNGNLTRLRERAEEFANKNPSAIKKMPPSDIRNLVEDLHIHQIEMEMQNEELRRSQLELQAARNKYSDLYDFAPVGYFTIGEKGTILEANVPGAAMLGVERGSLRGEAFSRFVTRDTQDIFYLHRKKLLETKSPRTCELKLKDKDNTEFHAQLECLVVEDNEGHLNCFAAVSNINKRKQMEEELLKAKKLESLGVFAGGIAHDFNNLMSAVVGYISLARTEMPPGSDGFKNLIKAEKASIQTRELTSRLITFSDGGGPVKETVPFGGLLRDSVVHSMKGSDMDARFSIPDNISPIKADEHQIRQVILNVATNAREAMAGKGTIHVSCENTDTGVKDPLTLKDGKYVKISIEDQGPGIPEEDRERIFDPYFSTKEMGTQKGMGLGLAVSDSIVKQHDGLITVKSELGTGTILSIYLPASEKEIVEAAPVKEPVAEKPVTRSGKILVMDDEEMVRDVSAALLGHMGYGVEIAVDGVEAIEMYKGAMASGKAYDAVILDLTNSIGMGGVEAIKRLLQIDPDIKAIVTSGYCNDPVLIHFREYGFRGFITKPYMQKDLDEAIMDLF
jgi:two-component system, cell cycle sensor histidine kinase and response regulator CckA